MNIVHRRTAALLLGLLASSIGLAACDGGPTASTTVTRARIERSIEHSYANRYVALSKILGHPGVTAKSLDAQAVCDKGGPTVADSGPGGDWICQVAYQDPNVPNADGSAKVEVNVHSNDCYTAAGSTKLVGPLNITDTKGHQVVNPAFEFDACFDPASNPHPDGTLVIVNATPLPGAQLSKPALTLPAGLVAADAHRRIPLMLKCPEGTAPCTGTIAVSVQGTKTDKLTYDVAAGATTTIHATLTSRQVRDGGIVILALHETSPPPPPAS